MFVKGFNQATAVSRCEAHSFGCVPKLWVFHVSQHGKSLDCIQLLAVTKMSYLRSVTAHRRFAAGVWKQVEKRWPQACQRLGNDSPFPGWDWALFVLASGWSCRSHQVKQVARCQVIEPFTHTWGGIDTARAAANLSAKSHSHLQLEQKSSVSMLQKYCKPRNLRACLCVYFHGQNKYRHI